MSYETEKNRIKVTKYRARKGLKEAGYEQGEIEGMLAGIDWALATPQDVLSMYAYEDTPEPAQARPRTPRHDSPQLAQEEEAISGLPAWVGNTIAIVVLLCLALYIFSATRPA